MTVYSGTVAVEARAVQTVGSIPDFYGTPTPRLTGYDAPVLIRIPGVARTYMSLYSALNETARCCH